MKLRFSQNPTFDASSEESSREVNNGLEALSKMTTLSIDSGDLDAVARLSKTGLITDATTNPLFICQAGSNGDHRYQDMVQDAILYANERVVIGDSPEYVSSVHSLEEKVNLAMDKLSVNLGVELSKLVPGRVSTEVDIRLSYDMHATVERARRIIDMYQNMGVDKSRILIKLAGSWEGIQAARLLEKEGVQCNITLIFSFVQAVAAAQAGAYLVSPFPGRILDWHRSISGKINYHPTADPGVLTIKRITGYFKKHNYKTICMPSSWRASRGAAGSELDEILALAGIDEMTLRPGLMECLQQLDASEVNCGCNAKVEASLCHDPDFTLNKEIWSAYWEVEECGKIKLQEGIEAFTKETEKLREILLLKLVSRAREIQ